MSELLAYKRDYELLTPEQKAHVANGCGPKFGLLEVMVPDFDGLYTPACNFHDWVYWSGGPLAIKKLADEQLRKDMELINWGLPWYKRWALKWAPRVYYWAVSKFGKPAWHRSLYRRTLRDLREEMGDAYI